MLQFALAHDFVSIAVLTMHAVRSTGPNAACLDHLEAALDRLAPCLDVCRCCFYSVRASLVACSAAWVGALGTCLLKLAAVCLLCVCRELKELRRRQQAQMETKRRAAYANMIRGQK
jgi:hypothetical protein